MVGKSKELLKELSVKPSKSSRGENVHLPSKVLTVLPASYQNFLKRKHYICSNSEAYDIPSDNLKINLKEQRAGALM